MSLWLYEAAPWYDTATNTLYVPASWTAGQVVDFLTEYAHDLNNPIGKRFLAELQTNGIFSGRIGFEEYNSLLKQGLAATAEQAEGLIKQAISLGPGGDLALAAWDAQNVGIISAALTFAKSKSQDLTLGASLGVMLGVVAKRLNAPKGIASLAEAPNSAAGRFNKTTTPWQRTVHQRSDIDWDLIRPDGLTNRQAARQGYSPMRVNPETGKWDDITLHHLNDDPRGGVVETWRSTHGRFHRTMSRDPNPWRTEHPDWARAWNNEQSAYWRWRTGTYNPTPTDRLRLPGDPQ